MAKNIAGAGKKKKNGPDVTATSKVFFLTYGCTFNAADTDALKAAVAKKYGIAESEAEAGVVVMNTCSVKDSTQEKILFKAKKLDAQGKKLVVTGCLAQVSPELVEKAVPGASIVGVWSNAKMVDAIGWVLEGKKVVQTKRTSILPFNVTVDGIFARVQISRGCLGSCTYCSTKIARGSLQSFPQEEIVAAVESAVRQGAKEIQLTSQDTACYGFDFGGNRKGGRKGVTKKPEHTLATLLESICNIPGRFRVRIGMGNPEHFWKIRKELAKAICSTDKVYRFLHIPVQSGSDPVLAAMNRGYRASDYARLVEFFRKKIPDLTVETDVIVGFPTETGKDFEETVALVEKTRPQITNISKYSARPKTIAARMKQVGRKTVNERSTKMNVLCRSIALEENGKLAGKTYDVLVTERKAGGFSARAPNYKTVLLARGAIGSFITVRTTGYGQCYLKGKRL
ncbi:MAG: tRNA (N(6)-L-threonylcarbamoyladenosine(37)-C(2))-methylthiotransferase [Candidatus Micrarchaeia archaeon]